MPARWVGEAGWSWSWRLAGLGGRSKWAGRRYRLASAVNKGVLSVCQPLNSLNQGSATSSTKNLANKVYIRLDGSSIRGIAIASLSAHTDDPGRSDVHRHTCQPRRPMIAVGGGLEKLGPCGECPYKQLSYRLERSPLRRTCKSSWKNGARRGRVHPTVSRGPGRFSLTCDALGWSRDYHCREWGGPVRQRNPGDMEALHLPFPFDMEFTSLRIQCCPFHSPHLPGDAAATIDLRPPPGSLSDILLFVGGGVYRPRAAAFRHQDFDW